VDVPSTWHFAILALAAFRITRLFGWDEWPPAARARAWLLGEEWHHITDPLALADLPSAAGEESNRPEAPGRPPNADVPTIEPVYRRPYLAHLFHCPWCLGFWISLIVWGVWQAEHHWTLVLLTPWALAGAASLTARNLDP